MRVCAAGILIDGGMILLGKRSADPRFYPSVWDLPGGHCLEGETTDDALIRELNEELGISPTKLVYLTLVREPETDPYGEYECHVFKVTDWFGVVRNMMPSEHSEIRWFSPDDAVRLDLAHPDYPGLFRRIFRRSV